MFKKFFAAFMSAVMVLSMLNVSVFADETPTDLELSAYDSTTSGAPVEPTTPTEKIPAKRDAIVVLDTSGSMGFSGRDDGAIEYAKAYAEYVLRNPSSRIALVSFGNEDETGGANVELNFTDNYDEFADILYSLEFSDDENMGLAIEYAKKLVNDNGQNDNVELLIITDAFPFLGNVKELDRFAKWSGAISTSVLQHAEWIYNFVKNDIPSSWHIRTQGIYYGMLEDSSQIEFAKDFLGAIANPPGYSNLDVKPEDDIEYPFEDEDDFEVATEETTEVTETTTRSRGNSSDKAAVTGDVDSDESGKQYEDEDVYVYGVLKNLPLIETYEITNTDTAVAAVTDMVNRIKGKSGLDINDEEVRYELANFAEAAISLSARTNISKFDSGSMSELEDVAKKAEATKAEINKVFENNNAQMPRDLLVGATVEGDGDFTIGSDVKTLPLDDLYVNCGEGGLGMTITKQFVEENAGGEDLVMSFQPLADETEAATEEKEDKNKENVEESAEQIDGDEVAASGAPAGVFSINRQVARPVTVELSLYPDSHPDYQGVKGPDGLAVSKQNNTKRKISARVSKSGTYTVTKVAALDFTDINNLTVAQKDTLRKLYAHGLIEGKSAKTFAPSTTLTRAEFTTLLIKSMGAYDASYNGKTGFVDMKNSWAEPIVAKAKNLGIVAGYDSDNTFRPDNKINNEQLYHMLGISYTKNNPASTKLGNAANTYVGKFSDNGKIGGWAKKNIAVSVGSNIYVPNQSGSFNPRNEVTRFEAAVAIGRFFDRTAFNGKW